MLSILGNKKAISCVVYLVYSSQVLRAFPGLNEQKFQRLKNEILVKEFLFYTPFLLRILG